MLVVAASGLLSTSPTPFDVPEIMERSRLPARWEPTALELVLG